MAKKILTDLDLAKNALLNAKIQNLASAPGSPVNGQVYYDTTLNQFGCYQNGSWVYLGASATNTLTQASASGGTGRLKVSAGADRTVQDYTSAGGIVKVAADGTVSLGVPGTDYIPPSYLDTDGTLAANSDTKIATQKATKAYVDGIKQAIVWKDAVRAATTAAGTLASSFANASVIDGVTLATGDRILIKDQATASENGIYTVNASGAPTRAVDADTGAEIKQAAVFVQEGTTLADTAWVNNVNGTITLGSTSVTFIQFSNVSVPNASTSTAGKVQLATQAEAEAKSDTAKAVVSADLVNFPLKRSFTIGDGSTTAITVTHNLGTKDVLAQVRDASTDALIDCDIVNTSTTVTTFTFNTAPATNAYRVVLVG